jgi:osmotically inducible protein OsmC
MKRTAHAVWRGDLKTGRGTLSTESKVLREAPYSFSSRFEGSQGTNPEELVAAAHAGCFSMALSLELEKSGIHPHEIYTTAAVHSEKENGQWNIRGIHFTTKAIVDKIDADKFHLAANRAKENCPISRLLRGHITLDAAIEELQQLSVAHG